MSKRYTITYAVFIACYIYESGNLSSFMGLLQMVLGHREDSIATVESVVECVSVMPAIIRVMPLSWTAAIITSVRAKDT